MREAIITTALVSLLGVGAQAQETTPETTNAASVTLDSPSAAGSAGGRFGAGLTVGEPTGASLKYWLTDTFAFDGVIGVSYHRETDLYLHSTVLWHKFGLFDVSRGELPLYFGVGPRWKIRDGEDRFGIRAPVGVSYLFEDKPVDIFMEVAPILDFTPSTRGGFTAGVGARYWF